MATITIDRKNALMADADAYALEHPEDAVYVNQIKEFIAGMIVPESQIDALLLSAYSKTIAVGEGFNLLGELFPNEGDFNMDWSSSNPSVASLSPIARGVHVTGEQAGTAFITAERDGIYAECMVMVLPNVIISEGSDRKIQLGSESLLLAYSPLEPETTFRWESSNTNVATVEPFVEDGQVSTNMGLVSAVSLGVTTIKAISTTDDTKYAECVVTVRQDVNILEATKTMNFDDQSVLYATVTNMTDRTLTWTSSDSNIVEVIWISEGCSGLRAKGTGTATITARSVANPQAFDTCEVTVVIPLTEVVISDAAKEVNTGDWFTLSATVLPTNPGNRALEWYSDHYNVVEVMWTSDGHCGLRAKAPGTAVITVRSALDPNISATCVVTVAIPITEVVMTDSTKEVNNGDWFTLSAAVLPTNPGNRELTWETSDSNIVQIAWTSDGACGLHANQAGTVTITARSAIDPDIFDTCEVTVT